MKNNEKQALDFLQATGTEMTIEYSHKSKYFNDGKIRDIYNIILKRGKRVYTFTFGQSLLNSAKYVDKLTGNEFDLSGGNLKGGLKVTDTIYLKGFCTKVKGTPPTEYDVLACLTKYDPESFEDFCSNFGYYAEDAEEAYNAVKDEYTNLCILYNEDELEVLRGIY